MIRKKSGRIISLILAGMLAVTSYVPSYAGEETDPVIDESAVSASSTESFMDHEGDVPEEGASKTEDEDYEETEPEIIPDSEEAPLVSDPEPVIIPINYQDDLEFSDESNQPPTSIEWDGDTFSMVDITIPFPDIPEGFALKSMWAVFKAPTGWTNLPGTRNDENSTYTFACSYFNSMNLEAGFIVGADFYMIYDGDPDKEVKIPIHYSVNYHFPDSMPKYVEGKVGERIYFIIPEPDGGIDGYMLNTIEGYAKSYGGGWDNPLERRIVGDGEYLFNYVVSAEDIESGINIYLNLGKIVDIVYEPCDHAEHIDDPDEKCKTGCINGFFYEEAVSVDQKEFPSSYYLPDYGYELTGLYYSEEMDDDHKLYIPGQNGSTQIRETMLSPDGKLHVYAKFEPITASIFLTFDGYSSQHSVTYGEVFPDFSMGSYSGYYVENEDGERVQIIPGQSRFDENIAFSTERAYGEIVGYSIYVRAGKSQYFNVSFDKGEDVTGSIDSLRVLGGKTISKPTVQLSKTGHYLAGWYTEPEHKNLFTFDKTQINGDTTLYAKWVPVEYLVTFHSNYGKDTTSKVSFKYDEKDLEKNQGSVTAGDIFASLKDKTGFLGWFSGKDLEIGPEATGKTLIEALLVKYGTPSAKVSLDLYAQWDNDGYYTVILDSNLPADAKVTNLGGSKAAEARANDEAAPYVKEKVAVDESFFLYGEEYTLKGFTLTGWEYTDSNGRNASLKLSASPKNLAAGDGEVTLKAKWKKVSSYKITYKLAGGTAGKNKLTVSYNATGAVTTGLALYNYKKLDDGSYRRKNPEEEPEVTRTGYDFAGWTMGDVSYEYYGDDIYQNLTLTAVWTPAKYTLKFMDPDGITEYTDHFEGAGEDATFDSSFVLKGYVPEKPGYTFKGWEGKYKDKVKLFTTKSTIKLKNLDRPADGVYVLTAKFAAASYKITYSLDGGKIGTKPASYTFGAGSSKAVPDPKKVGSAFAGWKARVNGIEYTTGSEDPDKDISRIIDPETKKIKAAPEIYGIIELVANWTPYTYDIKFFKDDGSFYDQEGNALSAYIGLTYNENVDLTAAAMYLEEMEGFDQTKSIKGFALVPAAKSPKYALYKNYSKLGAKAGNGPEIGLYPVLTGKVERINYSIILMPNANDVRISDDAEGFIDSTAGIQYTVPGDGDEVISEFAYNTTAAFNAPEWKRSGYELVGFGTSAKAKEPVSDISKLGNGKQSVVKLYAIWTGKVNTIHYTKYVHVYDLWSGYEFREEPSFVGTTTQVYKGKDVPLKTVSLKGYVFKGWSLELARGDGFIMTSPSIETGSARKVLKDNGADLYLSAFFRRARYTFRFDPNGGIYEGRKGKGIAYDVSYFNDVSDEMEEFYKGVSRKGYVITGLSTTKNGKNRIELYDAAGNRQVVSGLTEKDGANITVYPIWQKVSTAVPAASASLSPQGDGKYALKMTSSLPVTDENTKLIFEYSSSPLFIFGVKSVELTADPENPESVNSVTVSDLKNRTYYVRVRYGRKDSADEFVFGKNSKTVTAARSVR